jgi:hypothetical protein
VKFPQNNIIKIVKMKLYKFIQVEPSLYEFDSFNKEAYIFFFQVPT